MYSNFGAFVRACAYVVVTKTRLYLLFSQVRSLFFLYSFLYCAFFYCTDKSDSIVLSQLVPLLLLLLFLVSSLVPFLPLFLNTNA